MKKFIVERKDTFGNREYLSSLSEGDCSYDTNLSNALLVSENEKSLVRKVTKKNYSSTPSFISLKNFALLGQKALEELHKYECDFFVDVLTYSRNEGELGKELIKAATEDERDIMKYSELSNNVANKLIEKYDLKKKENH